MSELTDWNRRIFVISLIRREDRRIEVSAGLAKLGLAPRFFDAIEPEFAHEVLPTSKLQGGELALLASLCALVQDIEGEELTNEQQWVMICEDDVVLSRRLRHLLKVLDSLNFDQSVLKAGHLKYEFQSSTWGKIRVFLRPRVRLRSLKFRCQRKNLFPMLVNYYDYAGAHLIFLRKTFSQQFVADLKDLDLPVDVALNQLIDRDFAN